jgi:hypothetical protein
LKFACDRDAYRAMLRQQLEQFKVWLLDYCLTLRCRVVSHPRELEWLGYHEINGTRRRYGLLDLERLCWCLGTDDVQEARRNLEAALADAITRGELKREPIGTESLALGSAGFVEKVRPMVLSRRETEVIQAAGGVSVLQESAPPYGQKTSPKNDPKTQK